MNKMKEHIAQLDAMKKYPKELFFLGDTQLLQKKKISIVGSRKPTKYSQLMARNLASSATKADICVVSGGAMGIDAISHMGASSSNTIAVLVISTNKLYSTTTNCIGVEYE